MLITVVATTNAATSQIQLEGFSHGLAPIGWRNINNSGTRMSEGFMETTLSFYAETVGNQRWSTSADCKSLALPASH